MRLHVSREAGVWSGREIGRLERAIGLDADCLRFFLNLNADITQCMNCGRHFIGFCAFKPNVSARYCGRACVRTGLDSVGHHAVGGAMEPFYTVDCQVGRTDPFDLSSHRHQKIAQINDFRLARSIEQTARAIRQHRRHQCVFRCADRNHRKIKLTAGQSAIGRHRFDVTLRQFDLGAESFQCL